MNTGETEMLKAINKVISKLEKAREDLLSTTPLSSRAQENEWVIDNRSNTHYQMHSIKNHIVNLERKFAIKTFPTDYFDKYFRLATPTEVDSHLRYLNKKVNSTPSNKLESIKDRVSRTVEEWKNQGKIQLPEFYLVTVEGKMGCKVRHPDFQTAATEAKRLAKLCNHRAHIMSVCAIVEPVEVQKPITEYQLITK